MEVKRNGGDVARSRADEQLQAQVAEQAAQIDYIAMMADVDLPEIDGTESEGM